MKQIIIYLTVIGIMFVCGGCENQKEGYGASVNKENFEETHIASWPYKSDWLQNELLSIGLQNLIVSKKTEGNFAEQDSKSTQYAYLLNNCDQYGENSIYHDAYLAIETAKYVYFKDLSSNSYFGCGDDMYVCDIDGDGIDEIILQQTVGMTGGAGQYLSRIFKVVENEIKEIFNSSTVHLYNTGFTSIIKDDFKIEIQNTFTGYVKTIDVSAKKPYIGVFFDANGKAIRDTDIMCDSFWKFSPKDIDDDGVFEMVCLQYVSLYGHSDCIGHAKCVIKYNTDTQTFNVIDAEFMEK